MQNNTIRNLVDAVQLANQWSEQPFVMDYIAIPKDQWARIEAAAHELDKENNE